LSRVGKKPVAIPEGVEIKIDKGKVSVRGKLGELNQDFDSQAVEITEEKKRLIVKPLSDTKEVRSKYGLYRSLLNNMVTGVSEGFSKTLKIVGVGYRVSLKGSDLALSVGFSNIVDFPKQEGITFEVPDNTTIIIKGIDKQLVGQVSSKIRSKRPPEPYKGKGIRYDDEVVRRKVGKAAITADGAGA